MAENQDLDPREGLSTSGPRNRDRFEALGNINSMDGNSGDPDWSSDSSLPPDSDSEDDGLLDERLQHPTEYFRELDSLESLIFGNSMFQFYTVNL